jgi:hypothetical protein
VQLPGERLRYRLALAAGQRERDQHEESRWGLHGLSLIDMGVDLEDRLWT